MKKIFLLALLAAFGAGCAPQADWYSQTSPTSTAPVATTTSSGVVTPPKAATKPAPTKKTPTPPASTKVTVTITDNAFSPQMVAVKAGDTVVWVNKGVKNHTSASSGALLWDSGNIPPGGAYSRKFSAVGTYNYYDGVTNHTGTVIVR